MDPAALSYDGIITVRIAMRPMNNGGYHVNVQVRDYWTDALVAQPDYGCDSVEQALTVIDETLRDYYERHQSPQEASRPST